MRLLLLKRCRECSQPEQFSSSCLVGPVLDLQSLHRCMQALPEQRREQYEDKASRYNFGWSHGKEALQNGQLDVYKVANQESSGTCTRSRSMAFSDLNLYNPGNLLLLCDEE